MAPSFYRYAKKNPNILFIEVSVTAKNANLHQGLNVPSIPFGHIYHPTGGLVEELRISKKRWRKFEKIADTYASGSCEIIDDDFSDPFGEKNEEL